MSYVVSGQKNPKFARFFRVLRPKIARNVHDLEDHKLRKRKLRGRTLRGHGVFEIVFLYVYGLVNDYNSKSAITMLIILYL